MNKSTLPIRPEQPEPQSVPYRHPEPPLDPFGLPILPGDLIDWPPTDPAALAALDRWADEMERDHAERDGNGG